MPYKDPEKRLSYMREYDKSRAGSDERRETSKRWRDRNPERHKQAIRDWHARQPPEYNLFKSAKGRAKRVGVPFDIELSDIDIPEFCPYLEIPLSPNVGGKTHSENSPTLDRIIPELGYVKGNIQVISHKANVMKNSATPEQLETFARSVLRLCDRATLEELESRSQQ